MDKVNKAHIMYMKLMVETLKNYNEEKKAEGFIPTIELLIEGLQEQIEKYGDK